MTVVRPRRRARARGYTFVELLMSMLIFSIGVSGVIAMQKVTITSNQHAKDLAVATQISQAWLDQLRSDALRWNHPSAFNAASDLATDTLWLQTVAATNKNWAFPAYSGDQLFGPIFDVQGRPLDPTVVDDRGRAKYCVHLRLSWLYNPSAANVSVRGNGLIRAEIRVFWLRDGQSMPAGQVFCAAEQVAAVTADIARYHFVYSVSAVRENTLQ